MSTKWKILTGQLDDISCQQIGKLRLESSTIYHVHEVASFIWITLLTLTLKFYWLDLQYFMSTKWKRLTEEHCYISCPRSGKV